MRYKKFVRCHVPTKAKLVVEFSQWNYSEAGQSFEGPIFGLPEFEALKLLNKWNARPCHDYRYWLE